MSAGTVERRHGAATLIADAEWIESLVAAGFDQPEVWQRVLSGAGEASSGRGVTSVLRLPDRAPLRVKQMRRGGLTAALWHDRYPGRARPMANLTLPRQAIERGAPTPLAVALLTLAGPPGLLRAWLALEEIEPAEDLLQMLRQGNALDDAGWAALIEAVRRLHEAGVEHPDLNLGNLLLQQTEEGPVGWVLDLDRARLHPGPLPAAARERALARMERSFTRAIDPEPAAGAAFSERIRTLYAAGA